MRYARLGVLRVSEQKVVHASTNVTVRSPGSWLASLIN